MAPERPPVEGYRHVFESVAGGRWPVLLAVAVPLLAYAVVTGRGALALTLGASMLAAGHAFVVGIALGRGDTDVALAIGSVALVVVGASAVALASFGTLVLGSAVCLPAAALGYAAWERA
ncbi:hypothetical protein [Haloarchaeobius sp. HRN-SO-5]|uniref:hypothetical protein n=1 Tax=Haloarchaeobius sp. HRN-SO-5 TaxID=3446118 RepID=UPI003EB6A301